MLTHAPPRFTARRSRQPHTPLTGQRRTVATQLKGRRQSRRHNAHTYRRASQPTLHILGPQRGATILGPQRGATILGPQRGATILGPQRGATIRSPLTLPRLRQRHMSSPTAPHVVSDSATYRRSTHPSSRGTSRPPVPRMHLHASKRTSSRHHLDAHDCMRWGRPTTSVRRPVIHQSSHQSPRLPCVASRGHWIGAGCIIGRA